jgi:hypothetical protein
MLVLKGSLTMPSNRKTFLSGPWRSCAVAQHRATPMFRLKYKAGYCGPCLFRNYCFCLWETSSSAKNIVFWDLAPCRFYVNRRSGGTYRLHLQGRKITERGSSVSKWLQSAALFMPISTLNRTLWKRKRMEQASEANKKYNRFRSAIMPWESLHAWVCKLCEYWRQALMMADEALRGWARWAAVAEITHEYSYPSLSSRSQWPSCLKHEPSSPAWKLAPWVRIPLEAWMSMRVYSVFVLFCV